MTAALSQSQIAASRSYIRELTNSGKHLEANALASLLP